MIFLFLVAALAILGLVVFAFIEQWDKGSKRKLILWLVVPVVVVIGLLLLRIQLMRWTDCLPRNCPGATLVGRDLKNENLSNGNFVQADLSRANLYGARFVNASLSGAKLNSANLQRSDLTGAELRGADLSGADLAGARLDGADLRGANLTKANLSGIDLTSTNLLGAQFNDARLVAADLTGAQLNAVTFAGAQMKGAKLGQANLSGAVFSGANLRGADLADSVLAGAWLNLADMIGVDATNSDLSGTSLIGANLASANLSGSNLMGSTLVGVDLSGASVNAADLRNMRVEFATLTADDWRRDPRLAELNEGARKQIEQKETQLQAASSDNQTIWNGSAAAGDLAKAQEKQLEMASNAANVLKLGLLLDLDGPLTTTQQSALDAMLLAIDEINVNGGVVGRQLQPVVRSINTDPESFARQVRELIEEENVAVLFSGATSEQRKAALPLLAETDTPLFSFPVSEGFESAPQIFYVGAEPSQYVVPAVQYLLNQGVGSALLVGKDDSFSHAVNAIVKAMLQANGVAVVGEFYAPGSNPDFRSLLLQIQSTAPAVVISTLDDSWSPDLYRMLAEAGLDSQAMPVMNLVMSEEGFRSVDPALLVGHMVAGTYFQSVEPPEDSSFSLAFRTAYGKERITSEPIASAYASVYLWMALAAAAESVDAPDLRAAAASGLVEQRTPRGMQRIDAATQYTSAMARVGIVEDDGNVKLVYESVDPLPPDPYLTQFAWAARLAGELQEQSWQGGSQ